MGAWIEIKKDMERLSQEIVAPLVGAWIEIQTTEMQEQSTDKSLLSWERGLKYSLLVQTLPPPTSLLSWERGLKYWQTGSGRLYRCRSSRGSVD